MFCFELIDFNMSPLQIAGNILTLIGMCMFFLSSLCKKKKHILLLQSGNHSLGSIAQIFTAQYSGAVQDIISLIRNVFILLNKNNKILNYIFIAAGLIIGVVVNVVFKWGDWFLLGFGFLPVLGSFQYSIIILIPNVSVPMIKMSLCCSAVCWAIYGLVSQNYSMAVINALIVVVTVIATIRYFVNKKKIHPEAEEEEI